MAFQALNPLGAGMPSFNDFMSAYQGAANSRLNSRQLTQDYQIKQGNLALGQQQEARLEQSQEDELQSAAQLRELRSRDQAIQEDKAQQDKATWIVGQAKQAAEAAHVARLRELELPVAVKQMETEKAKLEVERLEAVGLIKKSQLPDGTTPGSIGSERVMPNAPKGAIPGGAAPIAEKANAGIAATAPVPKGSGFISYTDPSGQTTKAIRAEAGTPTLKFFKRSNAPGEVPPQDTTNAKPDYPTTISED